MMIAAQPLIRQKRQAGCCNATGTEERHSGKLVWKLGDLQVSSNVQDVDGLTTSTGRVENSGLLSFKLSDYQIEERYLGR